MKTSQSFDSLDHDPSFFFYFTSELQEKIEIRKKNLTVLRKETNKYQRTLISAPDDRPTSKYMGVTGALFISLVAGIIVCIDLTNFCKIFKPVRVKVE